MSINFISKEFQHEIKLLRKKQKRILKASKTFFILGIVFLILSFAPSVWYSAAARVDDFSVAIFETVKGARKEDIEKADIPTKPDYQPREDRNLPLETRLAIPSIKVDTQIQEAPDERYEEALEKGVWRVPDFGTPYDRKLPTILAAHRFGYLAWSNLYRRQNSFFNLPKLKAGDTVEMVYKQRKYVYEVYDESRGEEITDYGADLILYTCETLNSKVRIFKYAKLLEI